MKKIQAFVLALTMALTLAFSAVPMGVSAEGFVIEDGYTFYDTAYSPSKGIYLALAKSKTNETTKLDPTNVYKSTDGINWTLVKKFDTGYNANRQSRQNLVWWEDADVFIFAGGDKVYSSPDGETWTLRDDKGQGITRSNATITTDGSYLHVVGGRASKIVTSGDQLTQTVNHQCFESTEVYPTASGMSTADGTGARRFMAMTQWQVWTYDEASDKTAGADFDNIKKSTITDLSGTPVDLIYDQATEKWIVIDSSSNLIAIGKDNAASKIENAAEGANITAIGASDDMVLIGTKQGGIYAANAQNGITGETQWTAATTNGEPISEEVRSISATKNGEFLIATASKLYLGTKKGETITYSDVDNVSTIGIPEIVVEGSPFGEIQLLGGVYSPKLDLYVVYGNNSDGTTGGKIYTSKDGISWDLTHSSDVNFNTSKHAAVWWDAVMVGEETGAFVISTSTNATAGTAWYSADGKTWNYTEGPFSKNGDLAVGGSSLYTAANGYGYHKITKLPAAEAGVDYETISFTKEDVNWMASAPGNTPDLRHIAVSADEKYVFLSGPYGAALTYDTTTQKAFEANDGPNTAEITSAAWSAQSGTNTVQGCFIGTNSEDTAFIGMLPDAAAAEKNNNDRRGVTLRRTAPPAGTQAIAKFIAFADNGNRYVFGVDGGRVVAYQDMALRTAVGGNGAGLSDIHAANGMDNTLAVTNVFAGANGQTFVTVSDGSVSDILIVTADCTSYSSVSGERAITEDDLYFDAAATVKLDYFSQAADAQNCIMITAIYSADGRLLQTEVSDQVMEAGAGTLTQEITFCEDVNSDCTVKVMLWDSMETLAPIIAATDFFQ